MSLFLSLGVWLSLESSRFETTELLFQDDDNEANAASQRYCTQLCELFSKYKNQLKQFIRVDHANTHGVRKGSATRASSGTTCPPPVSSIAAQGEWSLGRVLDLYWHFAEPGDTFLGRVLAGFDSNGEEFATLPPHWTLDDPMSNERIKEAMNLMFATILQRWGGTEVIRQAFYFSALHLLYGTPTFSKQWRQHALGIRSTRSHSCPIQNCCMT